MYNVYMESNITQSAEEFEKRRNPTGFQPGDYVKNEDPWNLSTDEMAKKMLEDELMKNSTNTLKPETFQKDGNIDFVTNDNNQDNLINEIENNSDEFILLNKDPYPLKITSEMENEFDDFLKANEYTGTLFDIYFEKKPNVESEEEYIERTVYKKPESSGELRKGNITSKKPTGIFSFGNKGTTVYAVRKIHPVHDKENPIVFKSTTTEDPKKMTFNDINGMTPERKNKIILEQKNNANKWLTKINKLKSEVKKKNVFPELIELNKEANKLYKTLTPQPTEPSGGSILKKKKRKVHRSRKLSKTKKSKTSKRKMAKKSRKASKKGRKTRRK